MLPASPFRGTGPVHGPAKTANQSYAPDSFSLPVCRNIRIRRCRLLRAEACRGYCPSKCEYYYGFKVHQVPGADGKIHML